MNSSLFFRRLRKFRRVKFIRRILRGDFFALNYYDFHERLPFYKRELDFAYHLLVQGIIDRDEFDRQVADRLRGDDAVTERARRYAILKGYPVE